MSHQPFETVADAKARLAAWPREQTLSLNFAETPFSVEQRALYLSCLSLGAYVRVRPLDPNILFLLTDTTSIYEIAVFAHDRKVIAATERHRAYSGWDLVYIGENHPNPLAAGDTPQGLRARLPQPSALAAPRWCMPAEHAAFRREPLLFAASNRDATLYPDTHIPPRQVPALNVSVV